MRSIIHENNAKAFNTKYMQTSNLESSFHSGSQVIGLPNPFQSSVQELVVFNVLLHVDFSVNIMAKYSQNLSFERIGFKNAIRLKHVLLKTTSHKTLHHFCPHAFMPLSKYKQKTGSNKTKQHTYYRERKTQICEGETIFERV